MEYELKKILVIIRFMNIFIIIILIILLLYFINNYFLQKNQENFITGAHPDGSHSSWMLGDTVSGYGGHGRYDGLNCTPGTTCTYDDGTKFGLYNGDCHCISINKELSEEEGGEEGEEEEEIYDKYKHHKERKETVPIDSACLPNNTKFDEVCRNINPSYGIKKLIPCDLTTTKVECERNYINGKKYDDDVSITPCLNKSDDFDSWCRYYNNSKNIPVGNNVNSIGAKYILQGFDGACDKNSARAVCDYKSIETIPKLEPANNFIEYNKFTDCLPLNDDQFVANCSMLLNNDTNDDTSNILATQIQGYDCNPGYGRAKCVKDITDVSVFDSNFYTKSYTTEHTDLNKLCDGNC